jgi:hypothetical protein
MKISELIAQLEHALKHGDTEVVICRQTGADSWALVPVTDVEVVARKHETPYTVIE